jgi:hypothetical protein
MESIYRQNKMIPNERSKAKIESWLNEFNVTLSATFNEKLTRQEYGAHFSRWLPGEIVKRNKSNLLNSSDPYFQKLSKPKFLS